jgi:hypothetical protein
VVRSVLPPPLDAARHIWQPIELKSILEPLSKALRWRWFQGAHCNTVSSYQPYATEVVKRNILQYDRTIMVRVHISPIQLLCLATTALASINTPRPGSTNKVKFSELAQTLDRLLGQLDRLLGQLANSGLHVTLWISGSRRREAGARLLYRRRRAGRPAARAGEKDAKVAKVTQKCSHRNAWANLHLLNLSNTFLAAPVHAACGMGLPGVRAAAGAGALLQAPAAPPPAHLAQQAAYRPEQRRVQCALPPAYRRRPCGGPRLGTVSPRATVGA